MENSAVLVESWKALIARRVSENTKTARRDFWTKYLKDISPPPRRHPPRTFYTGFSFQTTCHLRVQTVRSRRHLATPRCRCAPRPECPVPLLCRVCRGLAALAAAAAATAAAQSRRRVWHLPRQPHRVGREPTAAARTPTPAASLPHAQSRSPRRPRRSLPGQTGRTMMTTAWLPRPAPFSGICSTSQRRKTLAPACGRSENGTAGRVQVDSFVNFLSPPGGGLATSREVADQNAAVIMEQDGGRQE